LATQIFYSLVVKDNTVVTNDTIVSIGIVGVQSDICINFEIWEGVFEQANGALGKTVRVEGLLSSGSLEVFRGFGEDDDLIHAVRTSLRDSVNQAIAPAKTGNARHGVNGNVLIAIVHENGKDEVARVDEGLAEGATNSLTATVAAGSRRKVLGENNGGTFRDTCLQKTNE